MSLSFFHVFPCRSPTKDSSQLALRGLLRKLACLANPPFRSFLFGSLFSGVFCLPRRSFSSLFSFRTFGLGGAFLHACRFFLACSTLTLFTAIFRDSVFTEGSFCRLFLVGQGVFCAFFFFIVSLTDFSQVGSSCLVRVCSFWTFFLRSLFPLRGCFF